jgi:hypothetical protein
VAAVRHGVRWAVDHTGPVGAAAEWAFDGLGYLLASGISWADEHTDGLASSTLQWIDGETYGGAVRRGLRENLGVGQRVAQNVGDAVRYTFDLALALLPIGPAGRARTLQQFERSSARTLIQGGARAGIRAAEKCPAKYLAVGKFSDFAPFALEMRGLFHKHHIIPARYLRHYGVDEAAGPSIVSKMTQHYETRSYGWKGRNLPLNVPLRQEIEVNIADTLAVLERTGCTAEELRLAAQEMRAQCEDFMREYGSHFPQ